MKRRIVCFGDSNTWGYDGRTGRRFDENVRWTGRLQKMLGESFSVIEEGLPDRTCTQDDPVHGGRSALAMIGPCLESHCPFELMIIMLGSNDLQNRWRLSPEQISFCLGRVLEEAERTIRYKLADPGNDPQILVISPIHIGKGITESIECELFGGTESAEKSERLAPYMLSIAKLHGCHYLDAAEYARPGESDSVHLDAENHRKLAEAVYQKTREILKFN